jgi:hypothetical protein
MDKSLIIKVKSKLISCTPETADLFKKQFMASFKPDQADIIYNYFLTDEPDYIAETCELDISDVLPTSKDYYITNDKIVEDAYLYDLKDLD